MSSSIPSSPEPRGAPNAPALELIQQVRSFISGRDVIKKTDLSTLEHLCGEIQKLSSKEHYSDLQLNNLYGQLDHIVKALKLGIEIPTGENRQIQKINQILVSVGFKPTRPQSEVFAQSSSPSSLVPEVGEPRSDQVIPEKSSEPSFEWPSMSGPVEEPKLQEGGHFFHQIEPPGVSGGAGLAMRQHLEEVERERKRAQEAEVASASATATPKTPEKLDPNIPQDLYFKNATRDDFQTFLQGPRDLLIRPSSVKDYHAISYIDHPVLPPETRYIKFIEGKGWQLFHLTPSRELKPMEKDKYYPSVQSILREKFPRHNHLKSTNS